MNSILRTDMSENKKNNFDIPIGAVAGSAAGTGSGLLYGKLTSEKALGKEIDIRHAYARLAGKSRRYAPPLAVTPEIANAIRKAHVNTLARRGAAVGTIAGIGVGTVSYLNKQAEIDSELKKDAVGLGSIAALGGVGNILADKVAGPKAGMGKKFLLGGGIGLGLDYVGMKVGQAYANKVDRDKMQKKANTFAYDLEANIRKKHPNFYLDEHVANKVNKKEEPKRLLESLGGLAAGAVAGAGLARKSNIYYKLHAGLVGGALSSAVASGIGHSLAVNRLTKEHSPDLTKKATLDYLVQNGVSFELACSLIKLASKEPSIWDNGSDYVTKRVKQEHPNFKLNTWEARDLDLNGAYKTSSALKTIGTSLVGGVGGAALGALGAKYLHNRKLPLAQRAAADSVRNTKVGSSAIGGYVAGSLGAGVPVGMHLGKKDLEERAQYHKDRLTALRLTAIKI